jgi:hypothetical protein
LDTTKARVVHFDTARRIRESHSLTVNLNKGDAESPCATVDVGLENSISSVKFAKSTMRLVIENPRRGPNLFEVSKQDKHTI